MGGDLGWDNSKDYIQNGLLRNRKKGQYGGRGREGLGCQASMIVLGPFWVGMVSGRTWSIDRTIGCCTLWHYRGPFGGVDRKLSWIRGHQKGSSVHSNLVYRCGCRWCQEGMRMWAGVFNTGKVKHFVWQLLGHDGDVRERCRAEGGEVESNVVNAVPHAPEMKLPFHLASFTSYNVLLLTASMHTGSREHVYNSSYSHFSLTAF